MIIEKINILVYFSIQSIRDWKKIKMCSFDNFNIVLKTSIFCKCIFLRIYFGVSLRANISDLKKQIIFQKVAVKNQSFWDLIFGSSEQGYGSVQLF